jgi:hypothetical protein
MKKLIIFESFSSSFLYWLGNVSKAIEYFEIKCESINGNFHYKTEGEWLYEKNKVTQKYKLLQTNLEVQYGLTANDLPSYINTVSINHKELKVKKYIGIGPNDFINLYNCEFLSKTNTQDIS